MCTAVSFISNGLYFGRNFDYEKRFDEKVVIVPRHFEFNFNSGETTKDHLAFVGVATVISDYPLLYDGMNEAGLCIAGLNFVGNAVTKEFDKSKNNISPYELIPYLLCFCKNVEECRKRLNRINLMDKPFKEDLPNPQLHWIVSDGNECITVEFVKEGMMVYENEVGVLTNNPIFPYHLWNLSNYSCIRNNDPTNNSQKSEYYSRGRGSWGIPGDYSSGSRFVRASFVKMNSPIYLENLHSVNQCFHILDAASHHEGTVMVGDEYEITQYTSVCDAQKGIYYIRTYRNSQINAVDLFEHNLNSLQLSLYKIPWEQNVNYLKP